MDTLYNIAHGRQTTDSNINIPTTNTKKKIKGYVHVKVRLGDEDNNTTDVNLDLSDFSIADIKEFLYAKKCVFQNYDKYKIASFKHQNCKNFDPLFNSIPKGYENVYNAGYRQIDYDVNYNRPLFKLHVFHNTNKQINVLLPGNVMSPAVHKHDLLSRWMDTDLFKNGNIFFTDDKNVINNIGPDLRQIFELTDLDPKGIVICTEYEIRRDNLENINPVRTNSLGEILHKAIYHVYDRFKDEHNTLNIQNIMFNRDITKDISDYVTRCLEQGDTAFRRNVKVAAFPVNCESDKGFNTREAITRTQFKLYNSNGEFEYNNLIDRDNYTDSVKFRLLFYIPECDIENEAVLRIDSLGISLVNGVIDHNLIGMATYRPNPLLYMRNDKKNSKGNTFNFTIITHSPYPVRYYINIGNSVRTIEAKRDIHTPEGIYLIFRDSYNNIVSPNKCIPLKDSESVGLYLNKEDAEKNANIDKRLEITKLENEKLKTELESNKLELDKFKLEVEKYKADLEKIKSENNILAERTKGANIKLDYEYKVKNYKLDIEQKRIKFNIEINQFLKEKEVDLRVKLITSKFDLLELETKGMMKLITDSADKIIKLNTSKDMLGNIASGLKDGSSIVKTMLEIGKVFL
ncbi:hypothetical protein ACVWU4_000946 [Campylobacter coli]